MDYSYPHSRGSHYNPRGLHWQQQAFIQQERQRANQLKANQLKAEFSAWYQKHVQRNQDSLQLRDNQTGNDLALYEQQPSQGELQEYGSQTLTEYTGSDPFLDLAAYIFCYSDYDDFKIYYDHINVLACETIDACQKIPMYVRNMLVEELDEIIHVYTRLLKTLKNALGILKLSESKKSHSININSYFDKIMECYSKYTIDYFQRTSDMLVSNAQIEWSTRRFHLDDLKKRLFTLTHNNDDNSIFGSLLKGFKNAKRLIFGTSAKSSHNRQITDGTFESSQYQEEPLNDVATDNDYDNQIELRSVGSDAGSDTDTEPETTNDSNSVPNHHSFSPQRIECC